MDQIIDMPTRGTKYSDQDRYQAAAHYAVLGVATQVERAIGIPHATISDWAKTEWWAQLLHQVRKANQEELDGRFSAHLNKALDAIGDRLDNGDEVNTREGPVRVKVKGKDAAVIAAIMFDKRQLLRSLPTAISADAAALDTLANRLIGLMADKRSKVVDSTCVVIPPQDST